MEMYDQQMKAEYTTAQRELIVDTRAAKKDGYQANLHRDSIVANQIAKGEGMSGNTAGLQIGEQSRQATHSIENANDRYGAAVANYSMGTEFSRSKAQNNMNAAEISPMTAFMGIAGSALNGIGSFG